MFPQITQISPIRQNCKVDNAGLREAFLQASRHYKAVLSYFIGEICVICGSGMRHVFRLNKLVELLAGQ